MALAKHANGRWKDSKKVEVVTTYMSTGSLRLTAAICKVPEITVNEWKRADWWKKIEEDLRNAENFELSSRLKNIVDKSLDTVLDRIEGGDHMFNPRTGEIIRVPVKLRDAVRAMDSAVDKRQLLTNQPTKIVEARSIEDRLANLANEFAKFSQSRTIEHTDEVIDAVEEERLQE